MNAKEFFRRYQSALRYKRRLEKITRDQYSEAIAQAQGVHGQQGTNDALLGVKVQSAPRGDMLERSVVCAVDRQRENFARLEQIQRECESLLGEILAVVEQMKDIDQREVLTARYIQGDSFRRIQVSMGWSERKTFRMHAAALSEAEKILQKMQKWQ